MINIRCYMYECKFNVDSICEHDSPKTLVHSAGIRKCLSHDNSNKVVWGLLKINEAVDKLGLPEIIGNWLRDSIKKNLKDI